MYVSIETISKTLASNKNITVKNLSVNKLIKSKNILFQQEADKPQLTALKTKENLVLNWL